MTNATRAIFASLAASAFFPSMVLGMTWPRVHRVAVILGMLSGLGLTMFYMVLNAPGFRHFFQMDPFSGLWWGIQPMSAGVFGVPLGFVVIILVSLVTPVPSRKVQKLVEHVRYPSLREP